MQDPCQLIKAKKWQNCKYLENRSPRPPATDAKNLSICGNFRKGIHSSFNNICHFQILPTFKLFGRAGVGSRTLPTENVKKGIVSYPIFTSNWNKFQLLYVGAVVRFLQHTSAYDMQNHAKPIILATVKIVAIALYTFLNILFPHFLLLRHYLNGSVLSSHVFALIVRVFVCARTYILC